MNQWAAEITNNPDKDYELYVELLEDDEYSSPFAQSISHILHCKLSGESSPQPQPWPDGFLPP